MEMAFLHQLPLRLMMPTVPRMGRRHAPPLSRPASTQQERDKGMSPHEAIRTRRDCARPLPGQTLDRLTRAILRAASPEIASRIPTLWTLSGKATSPDAPATDARHLCHPAAFTRDRVIHFAVLRITSLSCLARRSTPPIPSPTPPFKALLSQSLPCRTREIVRRDAYLRRERHRGLHIAR